MFEWRIFKKLPASTLEEFEAYVSNWKKNIKSQCVHKVDAYILLPPLFQELNCQFGLKLKSSKLRLNCLKSKLKGYKIELSERTKVAQNGFQLWNKTIEKKMKKKAKIHLETFTIYNCKKPPEAPIPQNSQQQMNVFTTKIQDERMLEKQSRFLVDQQELEQFLRKMLTTIKKKIQKYKINQASLNEYVAILEKCVNDQQVTIVIVEKYLAAQNEFEECPVRLRVVKQKIKEMEEQQQFNQFYLTLSVYQHTENIHIIEDKIKEWKQKYEIPSFELIQGEQFGGEFFIGGFSQFLTQFEK